MESLSYVAWLDIEKRKFVLDHYVPLSGSPPVLLPPVPKDLIANGCVAAYGLDCPQGLPKLGSRHQRRDCDREANTPTRKLPEHLSDPYTGPYASLIQVGVQLFAAAVSSGHAQLYGDGRQSHGAKPIIFETYPRKVLKDHFALGSIPSKRKEPHAYVDKVWKALKDSGYTCCGVLRPTVDQVDAMVCAVVAEHVLQKSVRELGEPPIWDAKDRIFREGYIVVPG
ncbi:DUF429 domain-containing protein [Alicyclobacillus vulcanalis]|nr:DUF429 domain-containing protein [Alicyclobacillus vulcanalis]